MQKMFFLQDALGHRPDLPDYLDILEDEYQPVLSLFYACTMEKQELRPSAKLNVENVDKVNVQTADELKKSSE
jgi:hypothetical protein